LVRDHPLAALDTASFGILLPFADEQRMTEMGLTSAVPDRRPLMRLPDAIIVTAIVNGVR